MCFLEGDFEGARCKAWDSKPSERSVGETKTQTIQFARLAPGYLARSREQGRNHHQGASLDFKMLQIVLLIGN
ncbi:hypothetical protein DFR59_1182 [Falsibacillus pallidus]|uniref:Uncharacterized protein n=1 Tax=Falsibacillus pallidus TaxID=493781 RepID=A0A370G3R0_9BACI|nr:hypothetical protein DFR59_1182 [Falsibacillus pallidus]